jgi:hypothetical protein
MIRLSHFDDSSSRCPKSTIDRLRRSSLATTIPETSPERQACCARCRPGRFIVLALRTSSSIRASVQARRAHSASIAER